MHVKYSEVPIIRPALGRINTEYHNSVLICLAVSRTAACVKPYLLRPEFERDTALHKQRDVIQLTGSTHCSSIPFIIYRDKEDKTHMFGLFLIENLSLKIPKIQ